MKKIKIKIISIFISLVMFLNIPLTGLCVSYADTVADYNPALIPIFTTVASVAIGLGIIGRNATDATNQLINNAISQIKYSEVLKATSDSTYNSPYRVVGANGEPEKPNNNNKNGKWFALGAASALGASVVGEKGMVEDIANTLNGLGAFDAMENSTGILSANDFKTQSSASQISLQLANISNSSVSQFDAFLHSDWWSDKDFTPDDCWFKVNVGIQSILSESPQYPFMSVTIYKKDDNLSFVDVTNGLSYYTYSNSYGSMSYYYGSSRSICVRFLNNDNVALRLYGYRVIIGSRNANTNLTYETSNLQSYDGLTPSYFSSFNSYPTSNQNLYAYCGYKWQHQNEWQFTNNVYNAGDTIINQYPNWDSEQISLLGQQIDALRIGIQSLTNPWDAEQVDIQSATSPENVIAQLINNYLNPENAPDPDPDPDPDPEPYAPEVFLPFSESDLEDGIQQLWEWTIGKIQLPDGFWDKIPFSIPYDIYLLTSSMFPVGGGSRRMLKATMNSPTNPNGITISSTFEASGENTRLYNISNKWSQTAPVINLDLHFKYHDHTGTLRTLDYVKTVAYNPPYLNIFTIKPNMTPNHVIYIEIYIIIAK